MHVTMRVRAGIPSLRGRTGFRTIQRVLRAARARFGLCVVEFAVMTNHLHLLVETDGQASLSRGMRGLATRLAIHLNRAFARRGVVFDDRFHARTITSPLEARRGLLYILNNARRHAAQRGKKVRRGWIDPCSSGASFDGWLGVRPSRARDRGTLPARTWLLRVGWRRHGLLGIDEVPGSRAGPPPRG